jgi:acetyl-CoA C-acetyltransferase
METIDDKVAVIGMGCTKFGENWTMSPEDVIVDAAFEAHQDAGIQSTDIQACWLGTTRLSTAEPCATALKFDHIPVTRVENLCATGSEALRNAWVSIASGMYDVAMPHSPGTACG